MNEYIYKKVDYYSMRQLSDVYPIEQEGIE